MEDTKLLTYDVDLEQAQGVAIGDHATQYLSYYASSEQLLVEESLDDVRSDAFVPPSRGEMLIQILQVQHLLVLYGPNRMGKAALARIVRFADLLLAQPELPDQKALEELFRAVSDVRLAVSRWLRKLDKSECYLVLTLALFDDLPEQDFWEIYERLVRIWQERDFAIVPLDYYALSLSQAFIDVGARISFKEPEYQRAVLKHRNELLSNLHTFAPGIACLGGSEAVVETYRGIQHVGRWWL